MKQAKAFTLLEMLAVVTIILVMLGLAALAFSQSRPAVKVKDDAARMVSFLRNMWDLTRATSAPLILQPNYEEGSFSYSDPRTGLRQQARFTSDARVIGVLLNDRYYSEETLTPSEESGYVPFESFDEELENALHISEGRGLSRIGVVFAIVDEDEHSMDHITLSALNLVTGKGIVVRLDEADLDALAQLGQEDSYADY